MVLCLPTEAGSGRRGDSNPRLHDGLLSPCSGGATEERAMSDWDVCPARALDWGTPRERLFRARGTGFRDS